MATHVATADPTRAVAPRLISSGLGPELDAPPAPVCGAPEGRLELVAGAVGVLVGDAVVLGDVVGLEDVVVVGVGDEVGDVVGDGDAVGLGDEVGDVVGLGDPDGPVELVVYVVAPEATEMKRDCSCITEPVAAAPL